MNFKYPQTLLQVFCKAPIPGQVKTRLMPALNAQQAADVYSQLCEQTLKNMTTRALCPIQLWCYPHPDHDFLQSLAKQYSLSLKTQQGNNLGERMDYAIQTGLKSYSQVILIGSDSPSLSLHEIQLSIQAFADQKEVVIAPTEDGGYCLIGMNRPHRGLFEGITWGQPEVYRQTQNYLNNSRICYAVLPTQWDVDRYEDYLRWQKEFC